MKPMTSATAWAWLIAIIVNVVVFDLLILRWENPGAREHLIAGAIALTSAAAVLLVSWRVSRGRR
jgi:hypothetical protein